MTGKGPLPGRIWAILAGMVIAALVCLALALVLGSRLRAMGPERGGGREGYMQVTKPVVGQASVPASSAADEAQLHALMESQGVVSFTLPEISPSTPVSPEHVPMEMPLMDVRATEVPPAPVVEPVAPVAAPAAVTPLTVTPMPERPLWQRNAVNVDVAPGVPQLAIVIDDMGGQMDLSRRAVDELPEGVTLSFFPWSKPGVVLAREARAQGHEIMIHMPMEALPHGTTQLDPGPDTLRVGMSTDEIDERLRRNVANLSDIAVGLNNHMGSKFTGWEPGVRAVLTVLQGEGMLFLDSKTAAPTATHKAARGLTLPVLDRDAFLDHVATPEAVKAELNKAVLKARKKGSAIAIGHPLPVTLDVLREELPKLVSSGIVLVPVTQLVKQ